jgi:hypothetical protein
MRACCCIRALTGGLARLRGANHLDQVKQGLHRAVGKRRRPDGCADQCIRHPLRYALNVAIRGFHEDHSALVFPHDRQFLAVVRVMGIENFYKLFTMSSM